MNNSNKPLLTLSLFLFILGLIFPVGAKLYNPYLAYAVMGISLPAWGIGAVCGGWVGFHAGGKVVYSKWGLGLCALNLAAIIAIFLIPFYAG